MLSDKAFYFKRSPCLPILFFLTHLCVLMLSSQGPLGAFCSASFSVVVGWFLPPLPPPVSVPRIWELAGWVAVLLLFCFITGLSFFVSYTAL